MCHFTGRVSQSDATNFFGWKNDTNRISWSTWVKYLFFFLQFIFETFLFFYFVLIVNTTYRCHDVLARIFQYSSHFDFDLSFHRIVYSFCTEGKDLGVWYESKTSKKNVEETSGADELCKLINDFLNNHLRTEVTKVLESDHGLA